MSLNIHRVGDPRALRDTVESSGETVYKVTTKPLPPDPRGYNWFTIFNEQLRGPLLATHDRAETITVICDTREYPNWLMLVDVAILRANEKEAAIPY